MRLRQPADHPLTYLVRVAFAGENYAGWQWQPNARTAQGVLEETFQKIAQVEIRLRAAGRTDSGVHVLDLPADFTLPFHLDTTLVTQAWNAVTPPDMTILGVRRVPDGFSARHRAFRRVYRYLVWNREFPDPFLARTAWHVADPLDVEAMRLAMGACLGEHDFSSFRAADCEAEHPIRRIDEATIQVLTAAELSPTPWLPFPGGPQEGLLCLNIGGTAFLKHQVRAIVGTLVEVGKRKLTPARFSEILAACDRSLAGPTAPAHGLALVRVEYPPGVFAE